MVKEKSGEEAKVADENVNIAPHVFMFVAVSIAASEGKLTI